MPWTCAHPAAILPLRRRADPRLVVALVMGTLVPDLAYYVGALPGLDTRSWGTLAHGPTGWLLLDAPLGALFAALLLAGRNWLASPLPQPYRGHLAALPPLQTRDASTWARLLLASAVGAATHLLWDGFTHAPGFFVQRLSWLRIEIGVLEDRSWQVFNVLQHLSTLVGLCALALVHARWRQRVRPGQMPDPTDTPRIRCLLGALLLSAVLGLGLSMPPASAPGQTHAWVVRGVIQATGWMVLAYIALAWRWRADRFA